MEIHPSCKLGDHEAKAEVVVTVVWRVVVAIRHATVLRVVVPTATTVHAVRASTSADLLVFDIFLVFLLLYFIQFKKTHPVFFVFLLTDTFHRLDFPQFH